MGDLRIPDCQTYPVPVIDFFLSRSHGVERFADFGLSGVVERYGCCLYDGDGRKSSGNGGIKS